MARTVLTYGGLNLNDGVSYFLQPGFDPGEREKTFDVGRGYGGGVLQFNITEAHLIAMSVPLRVQGAATVPSSMPISTTWPTDWTVATYPANTPVVALRFDDGTGADGDWDIAVPMLAWRGLVAGFAVAAHNVDGTHSPQYLNPAQLHKMESLGHEIMCHSDHHQADPASFAAFYNETVGARDLLRAMDLNVVSFVQPGSWTTTYNIDFGAGWTIGCPADLLLRANFAAYEGYLYGQSSWLPVSGEGRYGNCHLSPDTAAAAISQIDEVIADAAAGTLRGVEILFHSNTIPSVMTVEGFAAVLDHIAAKVASGDIAVLTPTQMYYAVPS